MLGHASPWVTRAYVTEWVYFGIKVLFWNGHFSQSHPALSEICHIAKKVCAIIGMNIGFVYS